MFTSYSVDSDDVVIVERSGSIGTMTLNRPKALNSLNLEMIRKMDAALDRFEVDPDVAAVLVAGAGERGLCAGGDIRMIFESGKSGAGAALDFWREEYRLNARISHLAKPYVVVLDGITMGGGVGISAHGSHRIATERLRLAMPETGIGFFPDVGASWLLGRMPGELGTYLGLTGESIGAADAIALGLADVLVPSDRLQGLKEALSSAAADSDAERISRVIGNFAEAPGLGELASRREVIDEVFSFDTVEEIFAALTQDGSDFAAKTLSVLHSKSPTALKIALRMLREGRSSASLEECLDREFSGSAQILSLPDFYEGVRAAVIDKDRNPKWQPASLAAVADEDIARFFEPHEALPSGMREKDRLA